MLHYHGTPITPRRVLLELVGRNFCVSFAEPRDVAVVHEIGQSVMLDNGAFSAWRSGRLTDWAAYYEWCEPWLDFQSTWAVIPDVIDGDEAEQDRLVAQWPFGGQQGAPVWHMHEPLDRLVALADTFPRVCLGSSGEYATVGDARWHRRMSAAMDRVCGNGGPMTWLHMLRGTRLAGSAYPFASVDSTSIAQNHAGNNTRGAPPRSARAMADEIDGRQCAARWEVAREQLSMP